MKTLLATAVLALPIRLATAQDLQPALNPTELARSQVNAGMMRGHAERDHQAQRAGQRPTRRPLTPAEQRRAHQLEVNAAMRRRPAAPGSVR